MQEQINRKTSVYTWEFITWPKWHFKMGVGGDDETFAIHWGKINLEHYLISYSKINFR